MDKRFWSILAVVVLVFGGVFFYNRNKASAPTTSKGSSGLTSHVEGDGASGITLIEYGDYQCPACGQYYPIVKQVVQGYDEQIKFQFRNFPLFQIHQNAIAGARAAEAADLQNNYWGMHDLLYQNQNAWSEQKDPLPNFKEYAKQLNLNVDKFATDFKTSLVNDRIQADLREGQKLGVDSTPTFFISDGTGSPKKISNPTSLDAFNKVIQNAIKQKTGKDIAPNPPTDVTPAPAPTTTETPAQ